MSRTMQSDIGRRSALGMMAACGLSFSLPGMTAQAATRRRDERPKSLITLWMNGGMSQLETWDPHPGTPSGGDVKSIKTSVPELEISDFLPQMAEQMHGFEASKAMQLTNAQREGAAKLFTSARADSDDLSQALRWAHENAGQVLDPHTAIGLHAARNAELDPATPVVTLATAHPAKFRDAVERAVGMRPALPTRVGDLFAREEAFDELAGDYDTVRDYITQRATPAG